MGIAETVLDWLQQSCQSNDNFSAILRVGFPVTFLALQKVVSAIMATVRVMSVGSPTRFAVSTATVSTAGWATTN